MNFRIFQFLLISVLLTLVHSCKKVPPKVLNHGRKRNGDNGYRLVIGNNPSGYEPGKIYNCKCDLSVINENLWIEIAEVRIFIF